MPLAVSRAALVATLWCFGAAVMHVSLTKQRVTSSPTLRRYNISLSNQSDVWLCLVHGLSAVFGATFSSLLYALATVAILGHDQYRNATAELHSGAGHGIQRCVGAAAQFGTHF
jgi:hypothetical protein